MKEAKQASTCVFPPEHPDSEHTETRTRHHTWIWIQPHTAITVISFCCDFSVSPCQIRLPPNTNYTKEVNWILHWILHPPRVEQLQELGQSTLNSDSQGGSTVTHILAISPPPKGSPLTAQTIFPQLLNSENTIYEHTNLCLVSSSTLPASRCAHHGTESLHAKHPQSLPLTLQPPAVKDQDLKQSPKG